MKDPTVGDEIEFVENLFDAICFGINEQPANQLAFEKAGCIKLMSSMIRERKFCKTPALRVMDIALSKCQSNCEAFVDQKGLKTLFSAFMGKGKKRIRRGGKSEDQSDEEHCISMIAQLFMNLSDVRYARLLRKFVENAFEKVERLIELHDKYYRKLEDAERKYQERKEKGELDDDEDESAEAVYLRRIENGLFTLQLIAIVIGFVSTANDAPLKERVVQLLHQRDASLLIVRNILREYVAQMTEEAQGTMKATLGAIIDLL